MEGVQEGPIFADERVKQITLQSMRNSSSKLSDLELMEYLQSPPECTVVRVNMVHSSVEELKQVLLNGLQEQYCLKGLQCPVVDVHPQVNDAVIIRSKYGPGCMEACKSDHPVVVVGLQCGEAVLRGSQVYAPGVMGIPVGTIVGSKVSVHADLTGRCKKGWAKKYEGPTKFVGNGILVQTRQELFANHNPSGVAVNMTEPLFDCPSIGNILLQDAIQTGIHKGFLQNLPSVVCGHALNVEGQRVVLDMCAAPGGKTTHIAALMRNQGCVVAIDKSANKIKQIQDNAQKLGLNNIVAYVFDSTKAVAENITDRSSDGNVIMAPPFLPGSFERICLDAPCSALGQRPSLFVSLAQKEMESFPRLQRKLFTTAVALLKPGGRMVYSTCSYAIAENEDIVRWALQKFPSLKILPCNIDIGQPGFQIEGLDFRQCSAMRRFGIPSAAVDTVDGTSDSIGFFLCCFEKSVVSVAQ